MHTTKTGAVLLSWQEPRPEEGYALRFSRRQQDAWSDPQTIAEGQDWFVNWADFPSVTSLDDSTLAAHFLKKSGSGTYAYDVRLTQSHDGGRNWMPSITPHTDGTQTEHGFASLLPIPERDRFLAIWLDGRNTGPVAAAGSRGAMTLRAAEIDRSGQIYSEALLDDRICDCCQTSAAHTTNGMLVVYRDRSEEEVRDISAVQWQDGAWTEPQSVHADQWQINGCPVNGPTIATDSTTTAVAWFTAAEGIPRVLLSFSFDEGRSFGSPISIADTQPLGRVDILLLPDRSALVSWLEKTDEDAVILVRRAYPDGSLGLPSKVAATKASRVSGVPRMARSEDTVFIAWTDPGASSSVQVAIAAL